MSYNPPNADKRTLLISLWFLLDAIVALAPPLYWAANDHHASLILGLPASMFYFIAVAACITASVIAAYWVEAAQGKFDE